MNASPTVVLFRHDLRVADNAALAAAAKAGPVIPLYILDDDAAADWKPGGASRWWLHESLARLAEELKHRGARLVLRRGATCRIVREVVAQSGAKAVHVSRAFLPWAIGLEQELRSTCEDAGCELKRFAGTLLHDPDIIRTQAGDPYKVYSPFWRALAQRPPRAPQPAPAEITCGARGLDSDDLESWELQPTRPDWAGGLREAWTPGEAGARQRLEAFLDEAVSAYHDERDRPDLPSTSRLSPYLAFGEISPATCWHAAEAHAEASPGTRKGVDKFLKELAWREFSYHLIYHWPNLPSAPFRQEFAAFPWDGEADQLERWQRGRTGFPLVDAGMRELWQTGWMHNRVRMIVASFLTKDLRVPWQRGEAWFWDCLVDADLANNAASWQWVAGCGADAAPYFRIFNPVTQSRKFDPHGAYIRRWVPEIAALPDAALHAPWEASRETLDAAGVTLGETYPEPMVDHARAREKALEAYEHVKARSG